MDENFFANLAGVEDEGETYEPELVSSSPKKSSDKSSESNDDLPAEIFNNDEALDLAEEEHEVGDTDFEDVEGRLTIDVYQDDDHIYIESTVAGVEGENLDVAITPESVAIRGKRKRSKKIKKDEYLYQECFWGSFSRSVILPQEIDPDKAKASLKNGVLLISLPKIHRSKSKKLKVKID